VDAAGGSGADFTHVAPAAPGDVLLVREGYYEGVLSLGDRSLTVVADAGALVEVDGLAVTGLAAGKVVILRGIDTVGFEDRGIRCTDCAGTVWIEDSTVHGPILPRFLAGGVILEDCAQVVMVRTVIEGPFNLSPAGATLSATRTRILLLDSMVSGSSPVAPGFEEAVRIHRGSAFLSGATVTGTRGPNGSFLVCPGGDGGDGLRISGGAEVVALGTTIQGGEGGLGFGGCADGDPGEAVVIESGSYSPSPTPARSLEVGSPAREGGPIAVTFLGSPGDRVRLIHARQAGPDMTSALYEGSLVLRPPAPGHSPWGHRRPGTPRRELPRAGAAALRRGPRGLRSGVLPQSGKRGVGGRIALGGDLARRGVLTVSETRRSGSWEMRAPTRALCPAASSRARMG